MKLQRNLALIMYNLSSDVKDICGFFDQISSDEYVINQIFVCVVYGLLCILTVLLNGISIFTILKCSQLNEKVSYFIILIQSAVDLITGLIAIPLQMSFVLLRDIIHVQSELFCRLTATFNYILFPLSFFTLCALSFERYMGVVHPFIHRTQVTKKRILIFECCASLLFVFYAFSVLMNTSGKTADIFMTTIALIAFLFLVFASTSIFFTARKSLYSRNRLVVGAPQPSTSDSRKANKRLVKEWKLAKSCFMVTCTFGLCIFPAIVISSLAGNFMSIVTYEMMFSWASSFGMLNCSVNSLIFFWSKPMLRKEAMKVLKFS